MTSGRATSALLVGLAVAVLASCGDREIPRAVDVTTGPTADPTVSTPEATTEAPPTVLPPSATRAVTVYYVGDGPRAPVLFREVRPVYEPDHGPAEQLGPLSAGPSDPDYRTAWPSGFFRNGAFVNFDDGTIDVYLADPSLNDRPAFMTEGEARASIQQVVYTLQEYAGDRLPVRFLLGDRPADRLLGVPTAEPVAAAPALQTLSLMSLTTPAEGEVVSGSFRASGFNNGYEGTAAWQVLDHAGNVVLQGATIGGWMGERLFPWHDRVDVSGLGPGTYTLFASTDDPTGGTEGFGPDTDTRTIVVK